MWGEMTRVGNRGKTTRGEMTRGETSWGEMTRGETSWGETSCYLLKHKTVLEFTISSGKLFHLLIVLTQNEFILNVFKAPGFFQFKSSLNHHAFECLRIRTVH